MVKNGDMFVTSMAAVRSDRANISQGYRIAENQAKTDLSNAIKTEIKTNFVDAQEGIQGDQFRTEFLSIEKSEIAFSGLTPANRYWEKVLVSNADGDKDIEYRFYARMKIKESDFKKQMQNFLNGNKGLSAEFGKRVTETVNEFTMEQYFRCANQGRAGNKQSNLPSVRRRNNNQRRILFRHHICNWDKSHKSTVCWCALGVFYQRKNRR